MRPSTRPKAINIITPTAFPLIEELFYFRPSVLTRNHSDRLLECGLGFGLSKPITSSANWLDMWFSQP